MTEQTRSAASQRARRRSTQAKRKVILAGLVAVLLAIGVLWIGRSSETPEPPAAQPPQDFFSARATDGIVEIPRSDADLLLVNGAEATLLKRADLVPGTSITVDLAVPIRLEGSDVFETRIMTEGRPLMKLEGQVVGESRQRLRINVPTDWMIPGTYLFEFRTQERTALPLRRFLVMVE